MSSGPSSRFRIPDADIRDLVVERTDESYIVQAPAGSGKTELLAQRFLALLATVEQPESVLAITFTRKAASEMRIRILDALDLATEDIDVETLDSHKLRRRELAQAVLKQDETRNWRLRDNPMRLQIRTVDSLSDSIARQLPMLAGISSELGVTEDSYDLYREAANRTIAELGAESRASAAVATLLRYRDNKASDVRDLLVSMLAKRDQWLRIITGGSTAAEEELTQLRVELEAALRRAVEEDLRKVRSGLAITLGASADALARLARIATGQAAGKAELPSASAAELANWRAIAELTLTKAGTIRKRLGPGLEEAADKNECQALLNALGEREDDAECVCGLLTKVRKLPSPEYTEDEWQFVRALLVTLPRCAAHLKVVFGEEAKVDFIEMALAAQTALESEEGPTELGLALGAQVKHLLLDEFQDTSQSQLGLVNALTRTWDESSGNTLFLVGDPMQSIYAFREAEVTIFTRAFRAQAANARDLRWAVKPVRLTSNFRSQRGLVEWFNRIHSQILTREDDATAAVVYSPAQPIEGALPNAVTVKGFGTRRYRDEATFVAGQVQTCLNEDPQQKIAILVRARAHLTYIVRELEARQIPFRAVKIDELAKRQTVLDLDALARAILDAADRTAWLSVLRAPYCGLTLADLWELCRGDHHSVIPLLLRERVGRLSADGQQRVARLSAVMESAMRDWTTIPLRIVVERAWISLGGSAAFRAEDSESAARDAEAYLTFLEERWTAGIRPGTRQFRTKLQELYAPAATEPSIRVELQTIHGAKGLEWDVVFLPALGRAPRGEDKQLLYWREQNNNGKDELLLGPMRSVKVPDASETIECYLQNLARDRAQEEKKRLLYVATTRAKKKLYLTATLTKERLATAGSLLSLMWPIQEIVTEMVATVSSDGPPEESSSLSMLPFRRLPLTFMLPEAPEPLCVMSRAPANGEGEALHTFDWAGETRRRVGTVTHAFLQAIGRDGVETWNFERVERSRRAIRTALMTEGVGSEKIDEAAQEVASALLNAISDERGRWILSARSGAESELPVTAMVEGKSKRLKIDRTFVEGQVRWVVDFKTTLIQGGDAERFFADQVEKYREDLARYADVLRLMDPSLEVRGALYFPLQNEFRVVPLEND